MPVIFAYEQVLNHLLQHGYVITFRDHMLKDKNGIDIIACSKGINWITNKRGGKKIADVEIMWWNDYHNVGLSVEGNELDWKKILEQCVEDSGFKSVEDWIKVIKLFNKGKIPARGYLYRVEIIHKYFEVPVSENYIKNTI